MFASKYFRTEKFWYIWYVVVNSKHTTFCYHIEGTKTKPVWDPVMFLDTCSVLNFHNFVSYSVCCYKKAVLFSLYFMLYQFFSTKCTQLEFILISTTFWTYVLISNVREGNYPFNSSITTCGSQDSLHWKTTIIITASGIKQ